MRIKVPAFAVDDKGQEAPVDLWLEVGLLESLGRKISGVVEDDMTYEVGRFEFEAPPGFEMRPGWDPQPPPSGSEGLK